MRKITRRTRPTREELEAYAAAGMTASEVGRRHGVGPAPAAKWFHAAGLGGYLKMGRPTALDAGEIVRAIVDGESLADIGKRHGISRQAVHQWVQRNYGSLEGMGQALARERRESAGVPGMRM